MTTSIKFALAAMILAVSSPAFAVEMETIDGYHGPSVVRLTGADAVALNQALRGQEAAFVSRHPGEGDIPWFKIRCETPRFGYPFVCTVRLWEPPYCVDVGVDCDISVGNQFGDESVPRELFKRLDLPVRLVDLPGDEGFPASVHEEKKFVSAEGDFELSCSRDRFKDASASDDSDSRFSCNVYVKIPRRLVTP